MLRRAVIGLGLALAALVLVGLGLIATAPPAREAPRDVFGFHALEGVRSRLPLPALKRFKARDGALLAYRLYPSAPNQLLVFAHGSSYHGAAYHGLAAGLSERGVATVALPNLRGHYQSGLRRGDVDYLGQLEDDLQDLIYVLRGSGADGPVVLGGHSSGGGLAIRFAGGPHGEAVSRFLLLSPVIPTSPTLRQGDAGGWARLHKRRLAGLVVLNTLGIRRFNALPIVEFNKPEQDWDGTETLSYSYRLNSSYHPRHPYRADLRAMKGRPVLVLIGDRDEAVDAEALRALFAETLPDAEVGVLPAVNHLGVYRDPAVLEAIATWLRIDAPRPDADP